MAGLIQRIPRAGTNQGAPTLPGAGVAFDFETGTALPPGWVEGGTNGPETGWVVENGYARPTAGAGRRDAIVDAQRVDGWLDTTLSRANAVNGGVIFRASGLTDYWRILNTTDGRVILAQMSGGSTTVVTETLTDPLPLSTRLRVHVEGTVGTLYVGAETTGTTFTLPDPTGVETWWGISGTYSSETVVARFEEFAVTGVEPA